MTSTVSIDGKDIFVITDLQKTVMLDSIPADEYELDVNRRLQWVINSKASECQKRMLNKWLPILQERYKELPSDPEALVKIICDQPDYKPAQREV